MESDHYGANDGGGVRMVGLHHSECDGYVEDLKSSRHSPSDQTRTSINQQAYFKS